MRTPRQPLDYEAFEPAARHAHCRSIVTQALRQIREGVDEIYLSAWSNEPGVVMPDSVRERNPISISIVLNHQFADLEVDDHAIHVTVWFNGQPGRMVLPFSAMISFNDAIAGQYIPFPDVQLEPIQTQGAAVVSLAAFRRGRTETKS